MNQNRIIAIIILVFNAWWAYLTSKLPKGTFEGEPGPRFFPYLILGLMTALAIVLFFQKEKKAEGDFPEILVEEGGEKIEVPKKKHYPMKSVFLYFGVFLGGIILVYFIGFILGMIISITAMLVLVGWKFFPRAILFSTIITLVVYFLFNTAMRIPLPTWRLFIK